MRATLEDIYISTSEFDTPLTNQEQWDKAKPELEKIIERLETYVKEEAEEW